MLTELATAQGQPNEPPPPPPPPSSHPARPPPMLIQLLDPEWLCDPRELDTWVHRAAGSAVSRQFIMQFRAIKSYVHDLHDRLMGSQGRVDRLVANNEMLADKVSRLEVTNQQLSADLTTTREQLNSGLKQQQVTFLTIASNLDRSVNQAIGQWNASNAHVHGALVKLADSLPPPTPTSTDAAAGRGGRLTLPDPPNDGTGEMACPSLWGPRSNSPLPVFEQQDDAPSHPSSDTAAEPCDTLSPTMTDTAAPDLVAQPTSSKERKKEDGPRSRRKSKKMTSGKSSQQQRQDEADDLVLEQHQAGWAKEALDAVISTEANARQQIAAEEAQDSLQIVNEEMMHKRVILKQEAAPDLVYQPTSPKKSPQGGGGKSKKTNGKRSQQRSQDEADDLVLEQHQAGWAKDALDAVISTEAKARRDIANEQAKVTTALLVKERRTRFKLLDQEDANRAKLDALVKRESSARSRIAEEEAEAIVKLANFMKMCADAKDAPGPLAAADAPDVSTPPTIQNSEQGPGHPAAESHTAEDGQLHADADVDSTDDTLDRTKDALDAVISAEAKARQEIDNEQAHISSQIMFLQLWHSTGVPKQEAAPDLVCPPTSPHKSPQEGGGKPKKTSSKSSRQRRQDDADDLVLEQHQAGWAKDALDAVISAEAKARQQIANEQSKAATVLKVDEQTNRSILVAIKTLWHRAAPHLVGPPTPPQKRPQGDGDKSKVDALLKCESSVRSLLVAEEAETFAKLADYNENMRHV